jgi:hypothetical protein
MITDWSLCSIQYSQSSIVTKRVRFHREFLDYWMQIRANWPSSPNSLSSRCKTPAHCILVPNTSVLGPFS